MLRVLCELVALKIDEHKLIKSIFCLVLVFIFNSRSSIRGLQIILLFLL